MKKKHCPCGGKAFYYPICPKPAAAKLESELGTSLFVRTRSDWQPTPAGEIYLQTAKTILALKKDTYSKIHDIAEFDQRHFTIGLIPERGGYVYVHLSPVSSFFSGYYP